METKIPRLYELLEARLEGCGKKDRTVNIKITINTARMILENEKKIDSEIINVLACLKSFPGFQKELNTLRTEIAKATT